MPAAGDESCEHSRVHVLGPYTLHNIDAVSRSHDVAVTMLLCRRHQKIWTPSIWSFTSVGGSEEKISFGLCDPQSGDEQEFSANACACMFACEAHRVLMRFSHETSAHWSVDGSLNYNYSYSRTFMAVTPCYRTWLSRPPSQPRMLNQSLRFF